ncbi:MAG: fumarate reductase/succinate dehydrogenase flavoprotein subunit, partial [bacterium]|nr:fumarate reductase/succinate dehydrogenase flavoprotein subunit [bacterium]
KGGKMLNQWRMAELHAKEAPDCIRELEAWGAVFDRTPDGRIMQRNFGGHTYPRLAHVGDRTGLEMIRTLQDKLVHMPAEIFMETTVTHLFKTDGRISGALAYARSTGEFHLFHAKAVVIATGGMGKAYTVTSNSWEYTGDGHSLAWEAGADLMDMEFIQFHPTGMVWPLSVRGTLVTEGVRGDGGVLKNGKGERFMFNYIPDAFKNDVADNEAEARQWIQEVVAGKQATVRRPPELLTRDVVARAIVNEVQEGRGSPHGGVFLDIASQRTPEEIKRGLPSMYHQFKKLANVDITKEAMEVGPTAHYIMGGVRVDPDSSMSTVKGLFAAGEAGAGLHGANRLGGNSLSDLLVFGRRAGKYAAEYVKTEKPSGRASEKEAEAMIAKNHSFFERKDGENPYALQREVQEKMNTLAGIIRNENDLRKALVELDGLEKRAETLTVTGDRTYNPGWHVAMDLRHVLNVSRALTLAAIERKESRGAHTRADFPNYDSAYAKVNTIIQNENGRMTLVQEPLKPIPDELKKLVEEA